MKTEKNWTASQREAIEADDEIILCSAGPGSGKSSVLVARIERLIADGLAPENIVALSFTNAGSNVLQERLGAVKLGQNSTLHSFALRMLKEHGECLGYGDGIAVISPASTEAMLLSIAENHASKTPPSLKKLMEIKGRSKPPLGRYDVPTGIVAEYYDTLKRAGVVDYDTILSEFRTLLMREEGEAVWEQFTHLFVDEVQDSSPIDWQIYDLMQCRAKYFVGDSDQAIFAFRGGSVEGMIALAGRPDVRVITLAENFRSVAQVCHAANELIVNNTQRIAKFTLPVSAGVGIVKALLPSGNEGAEIDIVSNRIRGILTTDGEVDDPAPTIAVLGRTNRIVGAFQKGLKGAGIDVAERTTSDLPRDWPLARAYVELLVNPENDTTAFLYVAAREEKMGEEPKAARKTADSYRRFAHANGQTLNRSALHLTRVTQPSVAMQALHSSGVSRESCAMAAERFRDLPPGATMIDFALSLAEVRERTTEAGDGVRCLTIHGAKGREFDVVFLVGCEDEIMPGKRPDVDIEEERRLCYVAITRARRVVYVTHSTSRESPFPPHEPQPRTASRFIREMLA